MKTLRCDYHGASGLEAVLAAFLPEKSFARWFAAMLLRPGGVYYRVNLAETRLVLHMALQAYHVIEREAPTRNAEGFRAAGDLCHKVAGYFTWDVESCAREPMGTFG